MTNTRPTTVEVLTSHFFQQGFEEDCNDAAEQVIEALAARGLFILSAAEIADTVLAAITGVPE